MPLSTLDTNNAYLPDFETSGKLVVDFSRNVKSFAVNNYTQLIPVSNQLFPWARFDAEESARQVSESGDEWLWPDGVDAPSGNYIQRMFRWLEGRTERRAFPWALPQEGEKQATLPIKQSTASAAASIAMLNRTIRAVKILTTSGNHISTHVLDVPTVGGTGTFAQSTVQRSTIRKVFNAAKERIHLQTLGSVTEDDLVFVCSPTMAKQISESMEIIDYLRSSPFALSEVKGELAKGNKNARYDLPSRLFGIKVEVEDAVRVTNKRGGTKTTQYVMPTATPFITARPGELTGIEGTPSFSAVCNFVWEDMKTESETDRWNRRLKGRVVDNSKFIMTANEGAVLLQNA